MDRSSFEKVVKHMLSSPKDNQLSTFSLEQIQQLSQLDDNQIDIDSINVDLVTNDNNDIDIHT